MQDNSKRLNETQKEQILAAVLEFAQGDPEILLEDIELMYWMSLEHFLYDDSEFRHDKTLSFHHFFNLVAKIDMLVNNKEGCKLIAI